MASPNLANARVKLSWFGLATESDRLGLQGQRPAKVVLGQSPLRPLRQRHAQFHGWSICARQWLGQLAAFGKSTPMRRLRRRPRAQPRPGMGVGFPNVLKTDLNFPDILKMGMLQFSKCLQSWFLKISRFMPRRKFPLVYGNQPQATLVLALRFRRGPSG